MTPYDEWAHDTLVAIPAALLTTNFEALNAATGQKISAAGWAEMSAGEANAFDVYPAVRIGDIPDIWYDRDEAGDTFTYIPGDGGQLYQITQNWTEKTYLDARKQARDILTQYFTNYDRSQFTAGQQVFSADLDRTNQYFKLDKWVSRNNEPYDPPQVVIDIDGNANLFTMQDEWEGFWNKFENLNQEARTVSWTAWKDVQDATTTDQVRQIINALPPIPGA